MKPIKYTKEVLIELAKQYKGPNDLKKANASAYKALRKLGLSTIVYPIAQRERHAEFTKEELLTLMSQCASRQEFQKIHASAYNAARRLNLVAEGIPVSNKYKAMGREPYTEEELIALCKSYKTIKEFSEKNSGAYQIACRKGLIAKYGPLPLAGTSTGEKELLTWLKTLSADFSSKRFGTDYQLDCYSESLKLGIEYNGLYWHSESAGKSRSYHLKKTKFFKNNGIRIIHIWEHEWKDRQAQVKNYLQSACKVNTYKIGARKCEFKIINNDIARGFLNERHIQGAPNLIKLAIGCYHKDILIAVSTFGPHHRKGEVESVLNRFACEATITVQGGLAKMSKMAFAILGPLKSWADYSKSNGNGYIKAGWKLERLLNPDYFYADSRGQVVSKQSRMKSRVNTPKSMTESEHAKLDGLYRIWDCGKLVLVYKKAA